MRNYYFFETYPKYVIKNINNSSTYSTASGSLGVWKIVFSCSRPSCLMVQSRSWFQKQNVFIFDESVFLDLQLVLWASSWCFEPTVGVLGQQLEFWTNSLCFGPTLGVLIQHLVFLGHLVFRVNSWCFGPTVGVLGQLLVRPIYGFVEKSYYFGLWEWRVASNPSAWSCLVFWNMSLCSIAASFWSDYWILADFTVDCFLDLFEVLVVASTSWYWLSGSMNKWFYVTAAS